MKVALICPAEERNRVKNLGGKPKIRKMLRTNRISVLAVAAATPKEIEFEYIDEYVEAIDFNKHFDLVGISFMTALAPRAYEIGDEFRRQGVTVVFGGYHPTFMPEEAIQHCDAICIGEAELNWPNIIEDFKKGELKRFYKSPQRPDLKSISFLRRDILKKDAYFSTNLILAGRGCPYSCDFCSVTYFFDHTYRFRPVDNIIQEINSLKGNLILFGDDNIVADMNFAKDLFRAMIPLRKKWMCQANLTIAEDRELLELAAKSGCVGLFIGLESLSNKNLRDVEKGFYQADKYSDLIAKINDYGIVVMAGFMFGFDHDDKGVFERTIKFTKEMHLIASQIAILTPFPGTPLYNRLKSQGRIFEHDWTKYDYRHVVFTPKKMTPDELQEGTDWTISEFYGYSSIFGRMFRNLPKWGLINTVLYGLPLNLSYKHNLRREIR